MKKMVVGLGLILVLAACGEEETGSSTEEEEVASEEVTQEEPQEESVEEETTEEIYGLGDTAEVDGVKMTITDVSITDERNEFEEEEPNQVVKIEYEMENGTDEEIPVGGDFQVYDGTGNKVDSYPLDNTMGSLKPGKSLEGTNHYGIEEGPIEVYFQPLNSVADDAIFEIEVEQE